MTKKIVIHTPMEPETFEYYKYMHQSVIENKSDKYEIVFKSYVMGPMDKISSEMTSFSQINRIDLIKTDVHEISSEGHARALNIIFENFVKESINIISDSDVVICYRNFDDYVVNLLENIHVIGTKYENIGGPCVEKNYPKVDTKFQTYKNRPNLIWCAFSDRHNFSNVRVTAPNSSNTCKEIITDQDESIWGLPKGYMLWKDAGWEFPKYLFDGNLKFSTFIKCNPYEKSSPEGTKPKVLDADFKLGLTFQDAIYSEEYQISNGDPFLIHQRGSRKRKFRVDIVSKRFYNAYERYSKNLNG